VNVIDVESDTVLYCVDVPSAYASCAFSKPFAIAITPDGTRAYVCNNGDNSVSVIDVESDSVVDCVDVPSAYLATCRIREPVAIAIVPPDGKKAYVCNQGPGNGSVSVIDLESNSVVGCVEDPYPYSAICKIFLPTAIAVTPDGTLAYVVNINNNTVSVIDVASDTVIACVEVPYVYNACTFAVPQSIVIIPDGTKAYVSNEGNNSVTVIGIKAPTIPLAPTNLTGCILQQGYMITNSLSWDAPASGFIPTTYNIYRDGSLIATVPGGGYGPFVYEDVGLDPSMTYTYNITSVYNFFESYPASITVTQDCILPPANLTGCILQEGYTITNNLSWDAPTSGFLPTSYNIYRNSVLIATVPGSGYGPFAYQDAGLDPSMIYTYNITSVYNFFESYPASITVTSFCYPELFPPTSLSGCTIQHGYTVINTITWQPPTSGAAPIAYQIYRDAYLYDLIATVSAAGPLSYQDTETLPNVSYTYYIVSVDSHGDRSEPASITVTQECPTPPTPSILPPASVSGCKTRNRFLLQTDFINNITWTAPASGTAPVAYKIYRDAYLTDLVATVSASGALQYYDHDRNPGIVYSYYIVSVDGNGNQSTANSVTVTNPC
jgi:YVTN family beta-propeller protein